MMNPQCNEATTRWQAHVFLRPPALNLPVSASVEQRDKNLRGIRTEGRKGWKKSSGYHRRSLVETAFFRLKTIFSGKQRSQRTQTQTSEAMIRCLALNRMTSLGMPQSYAV